MYFKFWHRGASRAPSAPQVPQDLPVSPALQAPAESSVSEVDITKTRASFTNSTISAAPLGLPRTKMVVTGRCTAPFCGCPGGIFALQIDNTGSNGELICQGDENRAGCGHILLLHESASSSQANLAVAPTPRLPLKPPQGEDPRRTQGPTRPPIWHDPTVCPRVQTVTNLWSLICEFRVVQCRGTPTSGKTILARLLQSFVTGNYPDMQVVYLSWPSTTPDNQYQWPFDRMLKEYAQIEYNEIFALSNLLLICDEAQNSYPFTSFWNDFIKLQAAGAQGGPYVAMFSSFGSPSPSAVTFPGSAPPYLSREQRIPLRPFNDNSESLSLYFPRSEYNDVITRVCDTQNRNNPSQPFLPSKGLLDYLFEITSGHPGCIRAILSVLIHSNLLRQFLKERTEINLEYAVSVITNPKFFKEELANHQGFGRCLPPLEVLQEKPDAAKILQKTVVNHSFIGKLEDHKGLEEAYKRGWLQAELNSDGKTHYIFPTEVHRLYLERILVANNTEFPLNLFGSLGDFWIAAIKKFSAGCLLNSSRTRPSSDIKRPLEAIYQDELYRACFEILGGRSFLISEWGASTKGRIDFYVSGAKWGIECLRDGIQLDEHISRFAPGGRYYQWIEDGELADYVILDFRQSRPASLKNHPHVYHVIYNDHYTECEILGSSGSQLHKFSLYQ